MDYTNILIKSTTMDKHSVQHFYHFCFGYLFPLVYFLKDNNDDNIRIEKTNSPMDAILYDFFNVDINNVGSFKNIKITFTNKPTSSKKIIILDRWDEKKECIVNYHAVADIIRERYNIIKNNNRDKIKVVLIERLKPSEFYLKYAFKKGSGTVRRSIPNINDVLIELQKNNNIDITKCSTENMPYSEQVALFTNSDIIIAQHGAVFANSIFMDNHQYLIEITHSYDVSNVWFRFISKEVGMTHYLIKQYGIHCPVNVTEISEIINKILYNFNNPSVLSSYEDLYTVFKKTNYIPIKLTPKFKTPVFVMKNINKPFIHKPVFKPKPIHAQQIKQHIKKIKNPPPKIVKKLTPLPKQDYRKKPIIHHIPKMVSKPLCNINSTSKLKINVILSKPNINKIKSKTLH